MFSDFNENKSQFCRCSLCNSQLKEKNGIANIKFSCRHSICSQCYAYLLIELISKEGISPSFLQGKEVSAKCPLCYKGDTKINFQEMNLFSPKLFERKQLICKKCKKNDAKKICYQCNLKICLECEQDWHLIKYEFHETKEIKEIGYIGTKKNKYCSCESRRTLKIFCKNCNAATCEICIKDDLHEGHQFVELRQILKNSDDILLDENTLPFMKCFGKKFLEFKKNTLKTMNKLILDYNTYFTNQIHKLINSLREIETKCKEKALREYQNLKQKLNLINSSIDFVTKEIEINAQEKLYIHPNKKFLLMKNLMEVPMEFENSFFLKDFNLHIEEKAFEEIKKIQGPINYSFYNFFNHSNKPSDDLIKFQKGEKNCLIGFKKCNEKFESNNYCLEHGYSANKNKESFICYNNPCAVIELKRRVISKGNFAPYFSKSNTSCYFYLKYIGKSCINSAREETFLAWAGISKNKNGKNTFPLKCF